MYSTRRERAQSKVQKEESSSVFLDVVGVASNLYILGIMGLIVYKAGYQHAIDSPYIPKEANTVYVERVVSGCHQVKRGDKVTFQDLLDIPKVPPDSVSVEVHDSNGVLKRCFFKEEVVGCAGESCDPSLIEKITNSQETCDNEDPKCSSEGQRAGS